MRAALGGKPGIHSADIPVQKPIEAPRLCLSGFPFSKASD